MPGRRDSFSERGLYPVGRVLSVCKRDNPEAVIIRRIPPVASKEDTDAAYVDETLDVRYCLCLFPPGTSRGSLMYLLQLCCSRQPSFAFAFAFA